MLDIKGLKVNYEKFEALRGIDLHVDEGEIVALLGANGAGKTTTINAVSGLRTIAGGDIMLNGESLVSLPPHEIAKRGAIQVPEGSKLFPYMTVQENLIVGSTLPEQRKKRKENMDKCYELFPKLAQRRKQYAGSLSGGEQRMCAIARALMQQPRLLMFDEPSLGLAPVIVDDIFDIIVNINKKERITILLVEQNLQASLDVASRAYVIEVGSNVLDGPSEEIANNPEIKQAYLGI